jgi:prepilin-type processing-associated H-X9-DG protein
LLVVIAVIATLAGMLLPALSRAKESGRRAACKSNLKQLTLALSMYVSDYSRYPPPATSLKSLSYNIYWPDQLQPYTQSAWTSSVYRCPSYRGLTAKFPLDAMDGNAGLAGSYGFNAAGTRDNILQPCLGLGWGYTEFADPFGRIPPVRESQVVAPSQMIALADSISRGMGWFILFLPSSREPNIGQSAHANSYTTSFCDGHVEFLKRADVLVPTEATRRRWNNDNEPHPETWRD